MRNPGGTSFVEVFFTFVVEHSSSLVCSTVLLSVVILIRFVYSEIISWQLLTLSHVDVHIFS